MNYKLQMNFWYRVSKYVVINRKLKYFNFTQKKLTSTPSPFLPLRTEHPGFVTGVSSCVSLGTKWDASWELNNSLKRSWRLSAIQWFTSQIFAKGSSVLGSQTLKNFKSLFKASNQAIFLIWLLAFILVTKALPDNLGAQTQLLLLSLYHLLPPLPSK